jgi:hypothetical protein
LRVSTPSLLCTCGSAPSASDRKREENRLLASALKDEAAAVASLRALEVQAEQAAKRALAAEVGKCFA